MQEGYSIKNRKGFTVIELLLAIILIGLISVMVTQLLGFNLTSTKAFSLYGKQQYTVQDALSRLNDDIQKASMVVFSNNPSGDGISFLTIKLYVSENDPLTDITTIKSVSQYKFSDGKLHWRENKDNSFVSCVVGFTDDSIFKNQNNCLAVVLVPEKNNTARNSINIDKPIITEYSLEYKKVFYKNEDED